MKRLNKKETPSEYITVVVGKRKRGQSNFTKPTRTISFYDTTLEEVVGKIECLNE